MNAACPAHLDPDTFIFYERSLLALHDAGVPFLVGGAYAFERYTGIARHTKDFDIFVRPADLAITFAALAATTSSTSSSARATASRRWTSAGSSTPSRTSCSACR